MAKNYAAFLLFIVIGWNCIQAKPQSYETLNATVDYVNQHLEEFWLSHKDLIELNRNLNSYFRSDAKEIPHWQAVSLDLTRAKDLANIPPAFITELKELKAIQRARISGMQALDQYFRQKGYLKDPEGKEIYQLLDNMADVFERFKIVHRQFEEVLSKENGRQGLMEPDDSFLYIVQDLHQQLTISRLLIKALAQQDNGNVRKQLIALKAIVERSAKRKTALLQSLVARPGSDHDPQKRFEAVLQQSSQIINLTETYLGGASIDPFFRVQGRHYYYYNQHLVNKFSREGESLVHQFNRFLSLHELPLLRAIGEPHTFKVVRAKAEVAKPMFEIPQTVAPVHLIFLLDVSGSMRQADKFPLFQSSFLYLVSNLRPEDQVSLISYSGDAKVHIEAISPVEQVSLSRAIQTIQAEGKTNIEQGLAKAYALAQNHFVEGGNNRIILVSDGGFPLHSNMLQAAQRGHQNDIQLSTLYMGQAEMEARARLLPLARQGGGNYTHVQAQNAKKALLREVIGK